MGRNNIVERGVETSRWTKGHVRKWGDIMEKMGRELYIYGGAYNL